jgi:hypothetical protein
VKTSGDYEQQFQKADQMCQRQAELETEMKKLRMQLVSGVAAPEEEMTIEGIRVPAGQAAPPAAAARKRGPLILPAFLTAVVWNLDHANPPASASSAAASALPAAKPPAAAPPPTACVKPLQQAVDIGIPPEIWGLLGISTASLIGSPLIKNAKRDQPATEAQSSDAAQKATDAGLVLNGVRAEKTAPDEARWADLIQGEEISNFHLLDLGKVQMLFFTVIVLTAYGAALAALFNQAMTSTPRSAICDFPELSGGMLALLAISHAGYLTYKAVPQTPVK